MMVGAKPYGQLRYRSVYRKQMATIWMLEMYW